MNEKEIKEELAAQAAFREKLNGMQAEQAHLFSSVLLDGSRTPSIAMRFSVEKVDGQRVIRMLSADYPI